MTYKFLDLKPFEQKDKLSFEDLMVLRQEIIGLMEHVLLVGDASDELQSIMAQCDKIRALLMFSTMETDKCQ